VKACRDCKYIFSEGDRCPACGSENVSDRFYGRIYILNVEKSEVAKLMNARLPGKYAVKVK